MSKDNDTHQHDAEKITPFLAPENMEYVICPECYGKMAKDALVCPHCGGTLSDGVPHDDAPKNKMIHYVWMALIGLGAIVIIAGLLIGFAGPSMIIGGILLLAASLTKRFA